MQDHIYRVIEIVGNSEKGVDDAIGTVQHVQVALKVGFKLDQAALATEGDRSQMRLATIAEPRLAGRHYVPAYR